MMTLEKFVESVRVITAGGSWHWSDFEELYEEAIAAERERCAKLAEELWDLAEFHNGDEIAREAGQVDVPDLFKTGAALAKAMRESKQG